jgi:RND family efflux transporter MFP subunit
MRSTLFLTLIALAAAALTACGGKAEAPAAAAPKAAAPQTVSVVTARAQDVPVSIDASGTATAVQSVDLRAQTTSTVAQVLVRDGQMVKQGELLFRFDDRADRAGLERARAQLARDRAALGDLERQLQRAQELLAQGFVTQSAVDTARSNRDAGLALVRSDEAAVQAAQVTTGYNELRAPISGRAGIVAVYPGSLVQPSVAGTPLVNIARLDPIAVTFTVPESQLGPLLAASRAGPLAAQAVLPGAAKGSAPLLGRVTVVDNLVDASTGSVKVKAEFDNKAQALWPGQFLRVRVTLQTLKDAVVLPQAAVILRGNERSVYLVGPDGAALAQPVQLRQSLGEQVVVEGVAPGAQVVVDGKQNLRPGTPLKIAGAKPAAAAAASAPASGASK